MKKLFILAFVAMIFAACSTDTMQDVIPAAPDKLTVSFEESSRVQLKYMEWLCIRDRWI